MKTPTIRFFSEVCNVLRNIRHDPSDIPRDFEKAAVNAISRQVPQIQVFGCFYHLAGNIWKHIHSRRGAMVKDVEHISTNLLVNI